MDCMDRRDCGDMPLYLGPRALFLVLAQEQDGFVYHDNLCEHQRLLQDPHSNRGWQHDQCLDRLQESALLQQLGIQQH